MLTDAEEVYVSTINEKQHQTMGVACTVRTAYTSRETFLYTTRDHVNASDISKQILGEYLVNPTLKPLPRCYLSTK